MVGSSAEIGRWVEDVRNVFKVSELNNSVKEGEYQENVSGKYEMWRRSGKS